MFDDDSWTNSKPAEGTGLGERPPTGVYVVRIDTCELKTIGQ